MKHGYTPIIVPFGTVEERLDFIKNIVKEFGGLK